MGKSGGRRPRQFPHLWQQPQECPISEKNSDIIFSSEFGHTILGYCTEIPLGPCRAVQNVQGHRRSEILQLLAQQIFFSNVLYIETAGYRPVGVFTVNDS